MSDLLTAASEALGTPLDLVSRSAAARAAANGTTTDEILSSWAGGTPVSAASPTPEAEAGSPPEQEETSAPVPEAADEDLSPTVTVAEPAAEAVPEPVAVVSEEVEPLEPVDLSDRLRTAWRVGTWTGAVLGLFAFVIATAPWSQNVTVAGEDQLRPVVIADATSVMQGVALVSVVFGAVVASFARAAAGWVNPSMALTSPKSSTAWTGALIGLVLGLGAGAVLANGFGTAVEGSEGLVELPVLATLAVMLIGGAILGGLTTLATQVFGVPVAVDETDTAEVSAVKSRLGNAVGIPMAGMILLLVLVLPFAWALIRSNSLTSGGAAVIAVVTAVGILAFASLAGSKPNMRIGRGELLVAVAGIGIVILIVFAVLANLGTDGHEEGPASDEAAVHFVIG